jgi:hypothetical protein
MASLAARHLDLALAGHRSKNIAAGYQSACGRQSRRSHHQEDGSKSRAGSNGARCGLIGPSLALVSRRQRKKGHDAVAVYTENLGGRKETLPDYSRHGRPPGNRGKVTSVTLNHRT